MLGIRTLRMAAPALAVSLLPAVISPASAATIFLPMNVANGNMSLGTINARGRIVAIAGGAPTRPSAQAAAASPTRDPMPMMWAMLTASFALVGLVLRRKKRTPSVTA